jgi:hypothetical protein
MAAAGYVAKVVLIEMDYKVTAVRCSFRRTPCRLFRRMLASVAFQGIATARGISSNVRPR